MNETTLPTSRLACATWLGSRRDLRGARAARSDGRRADRGRPRPAPAPARLDESTPALSGTRPGPAGLDDAVAEAVRRAGAAGVVDLLVAVLTDPGMRDDAEIDRYLGPLKSACRQTGRYREAIPVLRRIATLNPARRSEMAAELALVHAHLGEAVTGLALLEAACAEQRQLAVDRRSVAFCVVGELAATVLGHPDRAREVAAMWRCTVHASPAEPAAAAPTRPASRRGRVSAQSLSPIVDG